MQRTHNLVVEHTFVVVHVSRVVRVEAIEVLGQLGQVVGTAGLIDGGFGILRAVAPIAAHVGIHRKHLRVGLTEHLAIAHTAHGIAVTPLYHRPEVLRYIIIVGIGVAAIAPQRTCNHRNVLVGMTGTYGIDVARQGVEKGRTVEAVGCL